VLWLVADGAVEPFDGDLDDYRDWVLARSRRPPDLPRRAPRATGRRKSVRKPKPRQRGYAQRKPLADKLAKVEREMAALNTERKSVEEWLASPAATRRRSATRSRHGFARQGDLSWQLARLETEWLEISEALEQMDAALPDRGPSSASAIAFRPPVTAKRSLAPRSDSSIRRTHGSRDRPGRREKR
jgi:ATP-binding cassette subfamily F protein 3